LSNGMLTVAVLLRAGFSILAAHTSLVAQDERPGFYETCSSCLLSVTRTAL